MSDTPETDDQVDYGKNSDWAKFARKLERERDEARRELKLALEQWELCLEQLKISAKSRLGERQP
jgi:hypothetical protein